MLAIETRITSNVYRVFFLLHLLSAIVGFGAVLLNGLYGAKAQQRPGPEGRAISEANFQVSEIAEYFIDAVPVSEPAGAGPPPQVAEIAIMGKRLATTGPLLHVTMGVIMVLMIWKPGNNRSPVVWLAPETMPSASSSLTIIVA